MFGFSTAGGDPGRRTCFNLLRGTDEPCPDCPHRQLMTSGQPGTVESFYPCLGKHLRVSARPLLDDKGRVTHTVYFIEDITAQMQAEQIRAQYEQMKALLVMVRAVCHELAQPTQAVAGYSEFMLVRMAEDDPLYPRMEILRAEVDRMAQITNKLAYIARDGMQRSGIADRCSEKE